MKLAQREYKSYEFFIQKFQVHNFLYIFYLNIQNFDTIECFLCPNKINNLINFLFMNLMFIVYSLLYCSSLQFCS